MAGQAHAKAPAEATKQAIAYPYTMLVMFGWRQIIANANTANSRLWAKFIAKTIRHSRSAVSTAVSVWCTITAARQSPIFRIRSAWSTSAEHQCR